MGGIYVGVSAAYLVYLAFVWLAGSMLGLKGNDVWIFRIVLGILGMIGAAVFVWFKQKNPKNQKTGTAIKSSNPKGGDLDSLLKQAQSHLTSSRLGRRAKFGKLPIVLVAGDSGSAKTTSILRSGLEMELLAGHVQSGRDIIPTDSVNCWFSKGTVFVEAGGTLLADQNNWWRLIRRLKRNRLLSFTGRDKQVTRAAIVCVSVDDFLQPNASRRLENLAGSIRERVEELAHLLGVRLPVYVLFTKSDRIPFFSEYVRNLSEAESSQVLGTTLPIERYGNDIVFTERETERLGDAFQSLVYGLCDKRPEFLAREHDPKKLHAIYEFPREFGKMRTSIVKFLIDLCRPSQLRVSPFVRGFYFCGVRAIVPDERIPVPLLSVAPAENFGGNATRIFRGADARSLQPPSTPIPGKRIPQWTFLSHFFNDVLLKDNIGLGTSHASVRTSMARRVAAATATLLLLVLGVGMTTSYFRNRALQIEVISASQGIVQSRSAEAGAPSADDLNRIETLRQSLQKLKGYELGKRPLSIRWGLYSGHDLYIVARKTYYARFRQLLFENAQNGLVEMLKRQSSTQGPCDGDNCRLVYDALKAYLITTSNHDKSTHVFLSPILMQYWRQGRNLDANRNQLAQIQFDFYSDDLKIENPFSEKNEGPVVDQARHYLAGFMDTDRVYRLMLADARKNGNVINFNDQFAGSADVLKVDLVDAAFTKVAFAFMQKSLMDPDQYFNGEKWVLGDQAAPTIDRARLEQDLRARYNTEFISQWRTVIAGARVKTYADVPDAARKLKFFSSNQFLLLALFSLVAENTNVDSNPIKDAFQAPRLVAPLSNPLVGPPNDAYITALQALQLSLEQVASTPGGSSNEGLVSLTRSNATTARAAVGKIAQPFPRDADAHAIGIAVQMRLEDPITNAESLLRNLAPGELNKAGKNLCGPMGILLSKYPFNPASPQEATLQEMNDMFHPEKGALAAFYSTNLSKYLIKQGAQYVESPSGGISITPAFLSFWNRAKAFSDVVYPGNSTQPHLSFSLKPTMMRGINLVTLTIGADMLNASSANSPAQQFTWTGAPPQAARMQVRIVGGSDLTLAGDKEESLWAVFRLFSSATTLTPSNAGYSVEWVSRIGNQPFTLPDGTPVSIRFDLAISAPIFQKDYFTGMRCVPNIARP